MTDRTAKIAQEPFIFSFESPDWRWLAFEEVGRNVRFWQRAVADLAPPARVGIVSSPSAEALAIDLAVRSLGLVSVPAGRETLDGRLGRGEIERLLDPAAQGSEASGEAPADGSDSRPAETAQPGGCLVASADGAALLPATVHRSAMQALDRMMPDRSRREIVVHGRSLEDLGERLVIDWAVRTAAAIVVAPASEALASTVFWARPTLLHGSADQLAQLACRLQGAERGMRGLAARFSRLQRVVVCGDERLGRTSRELFQALGAEVGSLSPGRFRVA